MLIKKIHIENIQNHASQIYKIKRISKSEFNRIKNKYCWIEKTYTLFSTPYFPPYIRIFKSSNNSKIKLAITNEYIDDNTELVTYFHSELEMVKFINDLGYKVSVGEELQKTLIKQEFKGKIKL